eukprot:jgi/Ulvmu1/8958/UM005_0049.1
MGRNWLCSCFDATPVVVQAISTTSEDHVHGEVISERDDLGAASPEHGFAHPIDEWMPESAIADVCSELDTINEQGESQCTTLTDARSASKHTSSLLPQLDEFSEALSNPRTVAPAKHWYVNPDYGSIWRLRDSGEQIVFAMDLLRPIPLRHTLPASSSSSTKWPLHQRHHTQQVNSPSMASATGSSTAYSSVQSEDLSLRATTEPEPHWTHDRQYLASETQQPPSQPLQTRSSYGEHSILAMPSDVHPLESEGSLSESSPLSADYNFFTSPPMAPSIRQVQDAAILDRELAEHNDGIDTQPRYRSYAASPEVPVHEPTGHARSHRMTDGREPGPNIRKLPKHHDLSVHYQFNQRPPSILDWPDAEWGGTQPHSLSAGKGHSERNRVGKSWTSSAGTKSNDRLTSEIHGRELDIPKSKRDSSHRQVRRARIRVAVP